MTHYHTSQHAIDRARKRAPHSGRVPRGDKEWALWLERIAEDATVIA